MTTVPELITDLATVMRTVPGIAAAEYPAPNVIDVSPTVVFYWGKGEDNRVIHQSAGHQVWEGAILARILVTHQNDTPSEFARIDDLVTPIIDLFGIDQDGLSIIERSLVFGKGVSKLLPELMRNSLNVPYAGQKCYATDIVFDYRIDRTTGSA